MNINTEAVKNHNLRAIRSQYGRVSKPTNTSVYADRNRATRTELNRFCNELSSKYIPKSVVELDFFTSVHFIDRLDVDRKDSFNHQWVSTFFSKLLREHRCEFLYVIHRASFEDRIQIKMDGRCVGIDLMRESTVEKMKLRLVTLFVGDGENPKFNYIRMDMG